jgi:hypothetical protein
MFQRPLPGRRSGRCRVPSIARLTASVFAVAATAPAFARGDGCAARDSFSDAFVAFGLPKAVAIDAIEHHLSEDGTRWVESHQVSGSVAETWVELAFVKSGRDDLHWTVFASPKWTVDYQRSFIDSAESFAVVQADPLLQMAGSPYRGTRITPMECARQLVLADELGNDIRVDDRGGTIVVDFELGRPRRQRLEITIDAATCRVLSSRQYAGDEEGVLYTFDDYERLADGTALPRTVLSVNAETGSRYRTTITRAELIDPEPPPGPTLLPDEVTIYDPARSAIVDRSGAQIRRVDLDAARSPLVGTPVDDVLAGLGLGAPALGLLALFEIGVLPLWDLRVDQQLDLSEQRALLGGHEAPRDALAPGPGGPPDAVHIQVRVLGQVVVHHVRDALDIEPTRGEVADATSTFNSPCRKFRIVWFRLPWLMSPCRRVGVDVLARQVLHHVVDRSLHAAEDQREVGLLVGEHVGEHAALVPGLHAHVVLLDHLDGERAAG